MSLRKKISDEVTKAKTRRSSLTSIDENLDLGSDLKIQDYTRVMDDTEVALDEYNTKLSMVDESRSKFEAAEKKLADMSKRMLAGVGVKYGYDSLEYEKAGGTRNSDRRRPEKKSIVGQN